MRWAFLGRLICLTPTALLQFSTGGTGGALALATVAALSFWGLSERSVARWYTRWPILSTVDAAVVAVAISAGGLGTVGELAMPVTCFILGLLLGWVWCLPPLALLLTPHLIALTATGALSPRAIVGIETWGIPTFCVVLAALGVATRRSYEQAAHLREQAARAASLARAADERSSVARDLHDSLGKSLHGLTLASAALPALTEQNPQRAAQVARSVHAACVTASDEMRAILKQTRVDACSDSLCERLKLLAAEVDASISVRVSTDCTRDVPVPVATEVFMVAREALRNVEKHAHASVASLSVSDTRGFLRVILQDNGVGFDDAVVSQRERSGHYGVRGMHERIASLGGRLTIDSTPGSGTTVTVEVPLDD